MAAAGYGGRSVTRCKDMWENINKYFCKAKESGKKRPAHAKTCPYFVKLDHLYFHPGRGSGAGAASSSAAGNTNSKTNANGNAIASADDTGNKASVELLDVVVKYDTDTHYGAPPGFPTDGVRTKDDGEAVDMGRASGRAGNDHEDEVARSHGQNDDHDH
ncbi:trihelix transcription factor GTL2-like [Triticum dicoccoides]|uniref:trihelix transcription factor GTL2-like n=1 Tax=Triticum dicoccoides TaxID=85692 RepID=UPI00188DE9B0|nr:trihelix transcription factor GTL2-like [Triticum dicoccoides]